MTYSYLIKESSLTHCLNNSYFCIMASIIIHANSKKDISLLKELSEKMGLSSHILSKEEKEDVNFAEAMKKNALEDNLLREDAVAYYKSLKKK